MIDKKEIIDFLLDAEMREIKQMRKVNMRGLIRELLEDKLFEMSNEALVDYYHEVTGQ